jgi:hypothetical protein
MVSDPNSPDVLLSVANEVEAAAIVTALAEYDIHAISVGGYTSGFKAEAPGNVAIVVKLTDFDRAKAALEEICRDQREIDWSQVDVTESPEGNTASRDSPADEAEPVSCVAVGRVWWLVEILGIAVCAVAWLFLRESRATLIYAFTGLALFGLCLALFQFVCRER